MRSVDLRVVLQERAVGRALGHLVRLLQPVTGLQVHVLLADRGSVGDDGDDVGVRDLVPLVLDVQLEVHAVRGEDHVPHRADLDASVVDLGALVDAAGVRELRGHRVVVLVEDGAEVCVLGADEGHAGDGEQREDEQLDLDLASDHWAPPIVERYQERRAGSKAWVSCATE
jgi:hypothetical protein